MRTIRPRLGEMRVVTRFPWWPLCAWSPEHQRYVRVWLEQVTLKEWFFGEKWGDPVIQDETTPEDEFSPEVQRQFRELGIE